MATVLIRDVPAEDLDELRAAAASAGTSMQSYLRETIHEQAVYLRRQTTLATIDARLADRSPVPDLERSAVLEAIDRAHDERATELQSRANQ